MIKRLLISGIVSATLILSLNGCQKKDEVLNPDFTVGLTGTYPINYYSEGTQSINLPSGGISGKFEVSRIDMTHITMKMTLIYGPNDTDVENLENLELKRIAENTFSVQEGTSSYGKITPTDIALKDTAPNGTVTEIKAKR